MWNLVLWPGFERGPPALGIWGPRHWTTREVPLLVLLLCKWSLVSPVEDPPCPHGRAHSHPQPQLSTQVKRVPFVHCMLSHSVVSNSATPWTVAHQAHGILQARILEWVAISYSRESSRLRDWTWVCYIGRWILFHWATWEPFLCLYVDPRWGSKFALLWNIRLLPGPVLLCGWILWLVGLGLMLPTVARTESEFPEKRQSNSCYLNPGQSTPCLYDEHIVQSLACIHW